jgi:hypothetical protein
MANVFHAAKQRVLNRGIPPDAFLTELVKWGRSAPDAVFEPNPHFDIYSSVEAELGPWSSLGHRKAAMLEALRVLAGFESSWNWNAGRDTTNPASNTPCTEEAGAFQCSGNSMSLGPVLRQLLVDAAGTATCEAFILQTKADPRFAIDYCANLIRLTTKHHGPIKHRHINPWLRRDAVQEFATLLA